MNSEWFTFISVVLNIAIPFGAMWFLYSYLSNKRKEEKKILDSVLEDKD